MRINVLIPYDGLGGGIRIVAGYCNELSKRGHQVTVLPGRPPKTLLAPLRKIMSQIRPVKAESYFNSDLVNIIKVNFDDANWRASVPDGDALIATWWSIVQLAASLPSRHGQLVHLIQGDERALGCPPDRVMAMWRLPSKRVAVSRWIADVVRKEGGVDDIQIIRNAIDINLFDAPPRAKNATPTLGYIFSPHECKGGDIAAAVIERVRRDVKDLKVVCFGVIKPRLKGVRPPKGVDFIHRPSQRLIPSLYASCDVWLSTSRSEGSCLPPQEAMACRTPAVMTNVGDFTTPGLFGAGGFIVPIDDVEALVSKTLHVLHSNPQSWAAMSEAAWQASRQWTWEQATDEMERILKDEPFKRGAA